MRKKKVNLYACVVQAATASYNNVGDDNVIVDLFEIVNWQCRWINDIHVGSVSQVPIIEQALGSGQGASTQCPAVPGYRYPVPTYTSSELIGVSS